MLHRLIAPTYFGGLPAGYDYINDPAANGDPGVPAPADAKKGAAPAPGDQNEGTYFVAFKEPAQASNVNRLGAALAGNTDFLDDLLRRDLAQPTVHQETAGVSQTSFQITGTVFVGNVALGVEAGEESRLLNGLIYLTDALGVPLYKDSGGGAFVPIKVTEVRDSGNVGDVVGNGYEVDPFVHVSPALPDSVEFNAVHYVRSSLAVQDEQNYTNLRNRMGNWEADLWALVKTNEDDISDNAAAIAAADAIVDAGFVTDTFTAPNNPQQLYGGMGTAPNIQAALDKIDVAVVRRRAHTAILTNNGFSKGGDFNGLTAFDQFRNSTTSPMAVDDSGAFYLRRGGYTVDLDAQLNWDVDTYVEGEFVRSAGTGKYVTTLALTGTPSIVGQVSKEASFKHVQLVNNVPPGERTLEILSTGKLVLDGCDVGAGLLKITDGEVQWHGGRCGLDFGTSGAANAGTLEITGHEAHGAIRDVAFKDNGTYANAVLYMHDARTSDNEATPSAGWGRRGWVIENCDFLLEDQLAAGTKGALWMSNVHIPVTFRNCQFRVLSTASVAAGVEPAAVCLEDTSRIVFESCLLYNETGRALKADFGGATFRDCLFVSGDKRTVVTDAVPLISGHGGIRYAQDASGTPQDNTYAPLSLVNCEALYDYANVNEDSAPTNQIISLGALDGSLSFSIDAEAQTRVDGLIIRPRVKYGTADFYHDATWLLLAGKYRSTTIRSHPINLYRNITLDMGGFQPPAAASLSKVSPSGSADQYIVEALGTPFTGGIELDPGSLRIENLRLVDVRNPGDDGPDRGIVLLQGADADGVTLVSRSDQNTTATDAWLGPLVDILGSRLRRLAVNPTNGWDDSGEDYLRSNGSQGWVHIDSSSGGKEQVIWEDSYINCGQLVSQVDFVVNGESSPYSTYRNIDVFVREAHNDNVIWKSGGEHCSYEGIRIFVFNTSSYDNKAFDVNAPYGKVEGCTVFVEDPGTGDQVDLTGTDGVAIGNRWLAGDNDASAISVSIDGSWSTSGNQTSNLVPIALFSGI